MINVLSYIGMNFHSEVCLWTLLGLMRTIFDATLFRVNANLKQVWQMSMPEELSMSVQRVLRTMISGVMLAQCFTVYVYLASYIVVLYPVFLEERPNLVLPWLLLAAVRKLLCELMSLALGLGTCVLLGPARPPCIKFVIIKLISIMPAFYMWMLMYSYYHTLKVAAAFKTFPAVLPTCDQDYGLELAIRRRKTKSLLGEAQLRSKLVASLYGEERPDRVTTSISKIGIASRMIHSTDTSAVDLIKVEEDAEVMRPNSLLSNQMSDTGSYEEWLGSEVSLPRGSDRILEQFVLMLLRIGSYLNSEGTETESSQLLTFKSSYPAMPQPHNLNCMGMNSSEVTDTPLLVSSSKENTAQYLREYPQIFMRRTLDLPWNDIKAGVTNFPTHLENEDNSTTKIQKHTVTVSSKETVFTAVEKGVTSIKDDLEHPRNLNTDVLSSSKLKNNDEIVLKYTDMSSNRIFNNKINDHAIGISMNRSSESIINVCSEKTSVNQNASNINECSKATSMNENFIELPKRQENNSNQNSVSKLYEHLNDINVTSNKEKDKSPESIHKGLGSEINIRSENTGQEQSSELNLKNYTEAIKCTQTNSAEQMTSNKIKKSTKETNTKTKALAGNKINNYTEETNADQIINNAIEIPSNQLNTNQTSNSKKNNYHEDKCVVQSTSKDINQHLQKVYPKINSESEECSNVLSDSKNIKKIPGDKTKLTSEETPQSKINGSNNSISNKEIVPNQRNVGQTVNLENRETETKPSGPKVEVLLEERSHSNSSEKKNNDAKNK